MIQDLFAQLTALVSDLEPWQQVLALIPISAIPFIESYLGSFLGILVGIHPAIAIPAAVVGNLVATFAATALAGRARGAVLRGRGEGAPGERGEQDVPAAGGGRFRTKVAAALGRYGVPGVCLLGPLLVASQITAPTLVALGAARSRVYLWMGVSIVVWGLAFGLFGGVLSSVTA